MSLRHPVCSRSALQEYHTKKRHIAKAPYPAKKKFTSEAPKEKKHMAKAPYQKRKFEVEVPARKQTRRYIPKATY